MRKKCLIAPVFTAFITLSATDKMVSLAKPVVSVSPPLIPVILCGCL